MPISYPSYQTSNQTTTVNRDPDLPLTIPLVYSTLPIVTYGTESQKVANILIPPSGSYGLSGSSYNIMVILEITGAADATGSINIQPMDETLQFTSNIGMKSVAQIKYYGIDPQPFWNEPGFGLELYMSGSDTNLTCSLHKLEMIFSSSGNQ